MFRALLLAAFIVGVLAMPCAGETAGVSWTVEPKTDTYRNRQTKIAFPTRVASFTRDRATPVHDDGSASFGYSGKAGVITLYFRHRGISGCAREGDCVPRFLAGYRNDLKQLYGRADSETSFAVRGKCGGQSVRGAGTTYHFLHFPAMEGRSVYSEVGAVQVGDFIYYYRGTFPGKGGLADLAAFLRALGLRKV